MMSSYTSLTSGRAESYSMRPKMAMFISPFNSNSILGIGSCSTSFITSTEKTTCSASTVDRRVGAQRLSCRQVRGAEAARVHLLGVVEDGHREAVNVRRLRERLDLLGQRTLRDRRPVATGDGGGSG